MINLNIAVLISTILNSFDLLSNMSRDRSIYSRTTDREDRSPYTLQPRVEGIYYLSSFRRTKITCPVAETTILQTVIRD